MIQKFLIRCIFILGAKIGKIVGYFGIASKHLGKFEGQENKPQNGINQIFDLGVNP
ncbi:hypothetical protein C943_00268 [Mariniradius saccharolyticus AK6]|uniref:Uncharacterized protein n=1 Tax=Mariniradius saccharolyticus AK6 TaxID=1239962 RepID=M7Y6Y9_9BACT|nr:hypothetical protein C943_00268 [Mariniradius saccharolyticus AK6]